MVSNGEYKDTQLVSLIQDIMVPTGCELVASAITGPCQDCDPVMICAVSSWPKFIQKFADSGIILAHSIIDTVCDEFPKKIANLGTKPSIFGRDGGS